MVTFTCQFARGLSSPCLPHASVPQCSRVLSCDLLGDHAESPASEKRDPLACMESYSTLKARSASRVKSHPVFCCSLLSGVSLLTSVEEAPMNKCQSPCRRG